MFIGCEGKLEANASKNLQVCVRAKNFIDILGLKQ